MRVLVWLAIAVAAAAHCATATSLPMPVRVIPDTVDLSPGGRSSVHGWLWLPTYVVGEVPPPPSVLRGYWVHHTPEFWTTSPHDFQLLLHAELELATPLPSLPFAHAAPRVGSEFTFTPPYDFSLNDLIEHRPLHLVGNFFNGSFDTTFERVKMSNAKFVGSTQRISLVHYLNETSTDRFLELPYVSYPRAEDAPACSECDEAPPLDVYLAHIVHTNPDFDQVVHAHVNLSACAGKSPALLRDAQRPGATWQAVKRRNDVPSRLVQDDAPVLLELVPRQEELRARDLPLRCPAVVLEEIHCVLGPDFGPRCDGLPEAG